MGDDGELTLPSPETRNEDSCLLRSVEHPSPNRKYMVIVLAKTLTLLSICSTV